jgi:hypothetical protein
MSADSVQARDTAHGGDVNSVTELLYPEKMLLCVNWNRNGFFFYRIDCRQT